ncbi:MAG TPA: hypothetical protein VJ810_36765 [Blastocatellia bacterium]|nr:hypothetical protein [Blastocatellia bacterium]
MNSTKQILVTLVCLLLCAPFVIAQEAQPAPVSPETISRDSQEVTIIIQQEQLRFAAPTSAQELRLEVFNQAGEVIYDSGLVNGPELSWSLRSASGEAISGGLYAYTLWIKEAKSETPSLRRGHLIIESGRDRLWVTSQGAIGAETAISGELTVSSSPERSVAGTRIGRASMARLTPNLDIFGTPGRIPVFAGSDFLADSVISQDFNGRIGIGTERPGTALLTVAGQIETSSGGIKFPNGTVQTTSAAGALFQVFHNATLSGNGTEASPLGVNLPALPLLSAVTHDATLVGNGTSASPLGIADNGVSAAKIAPSQVVKSLNGLKDNVTLAGSGGISITPSGNTLNIAGSGLGSVATNRTLVGNGTSGAPLGVALPIKAALFVTAEGNIFTCYNGLTGEFKGGGTTNTGCGFTNENFSPGQYNITIPNVTPLFVSATCLNGLNRHFSADLIFLVGQRILVNTFFNSTDTAPTGFFLIVY